MARTFTKNVANYMNLGAGVISPLLAGKSSASVAVWVNPASFSAGVNDQRLLQAWDNGASGSTLLFIGVNGSGSNKVVRIFARSDVNVDAGQIKDGTSDVTLNTWTHIGGVVDIAGDTITPYFNGVAEGGGSVTFSAATFLNSGSQVVVDSIGYGDNTSSPVPSTTALQFDGKMADLVVWSTDIGANNFLALSKGISPWKIMPSNILLYWPLWGTHSPEIELKNNKIGTITGTISQANHAPVSKWRTNKSSDQYNETLTVLGLSPSIDSLSLTDEEDAVLISGLKNLECIDDLYRTRIQVI